MARYGIIRFRLPVAQFGSTADASSGVHATATNLGRDHFDPSQADHIAHAYGRASADLEAVLSSFRCGCVVTCASHGEQKHGIPAKLNRPSEPRWHGLPKHRFTHWIGKTVRRELHAGFPRPHTSKGEGRPHLPFPPPRLQTQSRHVKHKRRAFANAALSVL
jgi:hypothetical protein